MVKGKEEQYAKMAALPFHDCPFSIHFHFLASLSG